MAISRVKMLILLIISALIQGLHGSCETPENVTMIEDYEYNTEIVKSEVIVKFKGFYEASARKNYISAALNQEHFEILPRSNIMAQYPSDFDVVTFEADKKESIEDKLLHHPLIKSVTSQKKVTRYLKSLRKSLTLQNSAAFWQSTGRHSSRRLLRSVPRQITATMQADILWERGVTGSGVRVAIFDTGLSKTHPHFKRIRERTNWTNEKTLGMKNIVKLWCLRCNFACSFYVITSF